MTEVPATRRGDAFPYTNAAMTPDVSDETLAPSPRPPYFDTAANAWVLTRYDEVLAAFRSTRLWPVSPRGEWDDQPRLTDGSLVERRDVRDALAASRLAAWMRDIETAATAQLAQLPNDLPIELVGDFGKPFAMDVALLVTGTDPRHRAELGALGARIFNGTAADRGSDLRADAGVATNEMQRFFTDSRIPMPQPTFVGISQTMPRLLANGWLALFRSPAEVARLRADAELIPRAAEELLRFSGIIPRLFRRAKEDVDLGFLRVAAGERVNLMIASANRDPEKFPDPYRLDVSRRAAGQLALGIGHNSCAGATLIRTVNAVALRAMLDAFADIEVIGSVPWRTSSGFCWPDSVHVRVKRSLTTP